MNEIETCAAVMIFSVLAYTEDCFFPLQKMFPMNQELFDRCLDVCKDEQKTDLFSSLCRDYPEFYSGSTKRKEEEMSMERIEMSEAEYKAFDERMRARLRDCRLSFMKTGKGPVLFHRPLIIILWFVVYKLQHIVRCAL